MQLKAFGILLIVCICLVQGVQVDAWAAPAKTRIPIEIRSVGDDGLSSRFDAYLRRAFRSSEEFVEAPSVDSSRLIVTIPTNVRWKKVGRRTEVSYAVEFTSADGKLISSSSGSCWDKRLNDCAQQVLKAARAVR